MRDRLIELILGCDETYEILDCFPERPRKQYAAEILADYLIENNVVVVPRKNDNWIIVKNLTIEEALAEVANEK